MSSMIKLSRNCEAIQIPSGEKVVLREGTLVSISQSLGGAYTVMTEDGYMVRISGKDADTLGLEVQAVTSEEMGPLDKETVGKMVWEQLRTCFDPEIPINIVELGLVYDCQVSALSLEEENADRAFKVEVKMTLTAPGCGMGGVLSSDVQSKILGIRGVKVADVELVWDPPWNPSRMSDAAKLHLGMMY